MRAEDILPDDRNEAALRGVMVRKGTVAAFLANARIWLDPASDTAQKQVAEREMIQALPALQAVGLFEILSIRNAALARLISEASTFNA